MKTALSQLRQKPALLTAAAIFVVGGDLWGEQSWEGVTLAGYPPMALVLFTVALGVSLFVMFGSNGQASKVGTSLKTLSFVWIVPALLVHLGVALFLCHLRPARDIDISFMETGAARQVLQGHNPYGGTQPNIYDPEETLRYYGVGAVVGDRVQLGFPYPPVDLIWLVPGYLCGDIRYSFILAVLCAAFLMFALARNTWALYLTCFFLFNPLTFWVENRCWTEPLTVFLLAAAVYIATRHSRWIALSFGLFVAAKQYDLLALPLVLMLANPSSFKRSLRLLVLTASTVALTLLPFAVDNGSALFRDLVLFHVRQPFRGDALSFSVYLPIMLKIGPGLVLALIFAACLRLRGSAMFAVAFGSATLLFFITAKAAAANYFFLIACSFLIAAIAFSAESKLDVETVRG